MILVRKSVLQWFAWYGFISLNGKYEGCLEHRSRIPGVGFMRFSTRTSDSRTRDFHIGNAVVKLSVAKTSHVVHSGFAVSDSSIHRLGFHDELVARASSSEHRSALFQISILMRFPHIKSKITRLQSAQRISCGVMNIVDRVRPLPSDYGRRIAEARSAQSLLLSPSTDRRACSGCR